MEYYRMYLVFIFLMSQIHSYIFRKKLFHKNTHMIYIAHMIYVSYGKINFLKHIKN